MHPCFHATATARHHAARGEPQNGGNKPARIISCEDCETAEAGDSNESQQRCNSIISLKGVIFVSIFEGIGLSAI
jgi:hypothetical protein